MSSETDFARRTVRAKRVRLAGITQNDILAANRIWRSPVALVICMKVPEVTLELGPPKWDVFGKLKNSARNCMRSRSRIGNSRVMSRSVFHIPGARRMFRPLVPNVAIAVTGANAVGS